MIPLAIAIGIIEDKIANDLTGNKSTKEHLEELKEKFLAHKNKTIDEICVQFKSEDIKPFFDVEEIYFNNGFLVIVQSFRELYYNTDDIHNILRVDDFSSVKTKNDEVKEE